MVPELDSTIIISEVHYRSYSENIYSVVTITVAEQI
jgi:hypothetical protein